MMSPGLIERSASRMMPLTKFETIFCKPKPSPTPIAPLNTVNAVRSIPTAFSPISSARIISAILTRLRVSVWIDGLRPATCSMRPLTSRASANAAHSRIAISSAAFEQQQRQPHRADRQRGPVEGGERRLQEAKDVERRDDPGRPRDDAGQQRVMKQ